MIIKRNIFVPNEKQFVPNEKQNFNLNINPVNQLIQLEQISLYLQIIIEILILLAIIKGTFDYIKDLLPRPNWGRLGRYAGYHGDLGGQEIQTARQV